MDRMIKNNTLSKSIQPARWELLLKKIAETNWNCYPENSSRKFQEQISNLPDRGELVKEKLTLN